MSLSTPFKQSCATADPSASCAPESPRPLKVAVLVDLFQTPTSGGHVKAWERFARAAANQPGCVDLTVHYLGEKEDCVPLTDFVRFQRHLPRLSTTRFKFMSAIPDHTDLAGYHPGLAKALAGADVIHTTAAFFAFAHTALKVSRKLNIPLVNSVHTDTPSYTRVYAAQIIERILFGKNVLSSFFVNTLGIPRIAEWNMLRKLDAHQRRSLFVLVSKQEEYDALERKMPSRVRMLRRGIDKTLFNPAKRDRAWLQQRLGVPPEKVVALFVGRLSTGKNVMIVAEAAAKLAAQGAPIFVICAGQGPLESSILQTLGKNGACPGVLAGEELARLYASADLLAMPSEIEVFSNVVQEGMASGLPAVLAQRGGMGRLVAPDETGLIVQERSADGWAAALKQLCDSPARRKEMGCAARRYAEEVLPSWEDVLNEDLLPVWQAAAATRPSAGSRT